MSGRIKVSASRSLNPFRISARKLAISQWLHSQCWAACITSIGGLPKGSSDALNDDWMK